MFLQQNTCDVNVTSILKHIKDFLFFLRSLKKSLFFPFIFIFFVKSHVNSDGDNTCLKAISPSIPKRLLVTSPDFWAQTFVPHTNVRLWIPKIRIFGFQNFHGVIIGLKLKFKKYHDKNILGEMMKKLIFLINWYSTNLFLVWVPEKSDFLGHYPSDHYNLIYLTRQNLCVVFLKVARFLGRIILPPGLKLFRLCVPEDQLSRYVFEFFKILDILSIKKHFSNGFLFFLRQTKKQLPHIQFCLKLYYVFPLFFKTFWKKYFKFFNWAKHL